MDHVTKIEKLGSEQLVLLPDGTALVLNENAEIVRKYKWNQEAEDPCDYERMPTYIAVYLFDLSSKELWAWMSNGKAKSEPTPTTEAK